MLQVPLEYSDALWTDTARCTSSNVSSMLRDVRLGRPTEISFINGQVVSAFSAGISRRLVVESS